MKKRGVSVVIGYVLLISFAVVMGIIVYNWMKSYVPREDLKCPEDTSIFIQEYNCTTQQLNLSLKNNGKFNIGGFYIRVTNTPKSELATIDISQNITQGGEPLTPNGVKTIGNQNSFMPNDEELFVFNVSNVYPKIYSVEIVPIKWQEQGRKKRIVGCTNAKIIERLECSD